jgi:hypothetical protein
VGFGKDFGTTASFTDEDTDELFEVMKKGAWLLVCYPCRYLPACPANEPGLLPGQLRLWAPGLGCCMLRSLPACRELALLRGN